MKGLKIYLVYEHESFENHVVVLLTLNEKKAQRVSGENLAGDWSNKKNDNTERYYLEMELEKEYSLEIMSTLTF